MPRIYKHEIAFGELEEEELRKAAKYANTDVKDVIKSRALGKLMPLPEPLRELFDRLVIIDGRLRFLCMKAEDGQTRDELKALMRKLHEELDVIWQMLEER